MPKAWVDFKAIKSSVSMIKVLSRYGVELRTVNRAYLRGNCCLPSHQSDTKNSFGVNTDKNIWSCQSDSCAESRKGEKGGNVLDFVAWKEGVTIREAAVLLSEWFGRPTSTSDVPPPKLGEQTTNRPLAFELKGVQYHEYLASRGFDEEECQYLGVGFFPGKGTMQNRIVFPIHNTEGQLVAYAGRTVLEAEPRWMFPNGFHKGQVLYNLDRVEGSSVIVVESFWGVLACARAGILNCVALMGSTATEEQVSLLSRFETITLMLDGDQAGRKGTTELLTKLAKRNIPAVEIVLLKGQPDDLTPDELHETLGVPIHELAYSLTPLGISQLEVLKSA
ncbi:MAG TPA: toprim domain-containing protein [Thermoanaerobaculia bacterium]|nr:toprim domain-containing protein [Thermoanaerobaculia bacterium]